MLLELMNILITKLIPDFAFVGINSNAREIFQNMNFLKY